MSDRRKYTATVPAKKVASDTERNLANVAKKFKAEVLGTRKLSDGRFQMGLSMDEDTFRKKEEFVIAMTQIGAVFKDCGPDDGRRAKKPDEPKPEKKPTARPKAAAKKPKPEPKPEAEEGETADEVPVIVPIKDAFKRWSPLGGDDHKKAESILGRGCEDKVMAEWGKFAIDRQRLVDACFTLVGEEAAKKWREAHIGQGAWNVPWREIEPLVNLAFKKDDAEFIKWHCCHHGKRG